MISTYFYVLKAHNSKSTVLVSSRKVLSPKKVEKKRILISTILTDDLQNYAKGAEKLIKSIHGKTKNIGGLDFKILEIDSKPIADLEIRKKLEDAGWTFVRLPRIPPRNEDATFPRFRDQFTKLHFWNMTDYERVIYFDSDCLVVGEITELITMNITSKPLWVTRDLRGARWVDAFNMGVFVVAPSRTEFERLLKDKDDPRVEFESTMSEQGFLNVIYQGNWGEIGFRNNANLAVYTDDRPYWDRHEAMGINVVHFTMSKPWQCSDPYQAICELWSEEK